MKTILVLCALGITSVLLLIDNANTAALRLKLEAQRHQMQEHASLRTERDRLRAAQPDATELARLQREAAERARRQRGLAVSERYPTRPPPRALTLGESLPPAAWQDRGCATPVATVETMLWAAAGGDVARLGTLLQLDDLAGAKAKAIFAQLPERSRALYANAEDFITAWTARAVPLGDAQLVWQHQHDADNAIACVWIANPESGRSSAPTPATLRRPNDPPMAPPSDQRNQAFLQLRRTEAGWRVIVPARALNNLAKELGQPL